MTKYQDQKVTLGEKGLFVLILKRNQDRNSGMNVETGTKAETTEEYFLLICS